MEFKKRTFLKDLSLTTASSGAIACLVGYLSSAALVFQMAKALGLNSMQASQWIGILCLAMGIITIGMSLKYKMPIMFAWSTPGVAVLLGGFNGHSVQQAVGIFILSSIFTILIALSGQFDRLMRLIPSEISSALIAGILLKFCLNAFSVLNELPLVLGLMLAVFLITKRFKAFYAVPVSLFFGVLVLALTQGIQFQNIDLAIHRPEFWWPEFRIQDAIGLAFPLCLVTMTSQNVTGYAVLKSNDFNVSGSKMILVAGLTNLLVAPFGGFSLNLSSLTAAIIAGPEADPDKNRRYTGAVVSGVIYIVMGLFASAFAGLLGVIPPSMVVVIGGLALMSVVGLNLEKSFHRPGYKEAAFFTFLVAASKFEVMGVGSAFWALVVGLIVLKVLPTAQNKKAN